MPLNRRKKRIYNFYCSEQEKKTYQYIFHSDATMPNEKS
jgi:hypothetical protein